MKLAFNYLRPVPPAADDFRQGVPLELVQPQSGRRMSLSRSAALDLVYHADDGRTARAVAEPRPPDPRGAHWVARNWTWSLPLYLFSRGVAFADEKDGHDAGIRREVLGGYLRHSRPPAPQAPDGPRLPLPVPSESPGALARSLGDVLASRRSVPRPGARPLPLSELGDLLWAALPRLRDSLAVAQDYERDPVALLTSLGCAFDLYLVAYDVTGLDPGVYRYLPVEHELIGRPLDGAPGPEPATDTAALRELMRRVLIGQPAPLTAAASVCVVAEFERYQWRYRHERALRLLYIDAGRVMAYLQGTATAFGKSTHITPAARDSRAAEFFGYDPASRQLLYSLSLS
jgi:SagB-type dehydrogenase family enzyme